MAVVTTKSTNLESLDASPSAISPIGLVGGRVRVRKALVATSVSPTDSAGSQYRFFRVHAQDQIVSIKLFNHALSSGTDFDFGAYDIKDGSALDVNAFGDGLDLSSARTAGTELYFDNINVLHAEFFLWQFAIGGSVDPGNKEYDFVATSNSGGGAGGSILIIMQYTTGD